MRDYVESWQNLSLVGLQEKITDLFTSKLEMWCISPSIYDDISIKNKKKFLENIENIHKELFYDIRKNINFNLFADYNFNEEENSG